MTEMNKNSRDYSLDIIRIVSCFLVVLMHSPMPSTEANGPFLCALSYFTSPCIGLFFMVSGALLLPVKMDYFTFVRRRLSKVVIPTLIWTAIYLALNLYYTGLEINLLRAVASMPFSAQGHGVLWFMYTLVGLYLLAPILSAWVVTATDRELYFVLLLWAVTLCYPLLSLGVEITTSTAGMLYYFTGYAGYFVLGYALKSGRLKLSASWSTAIALSGVALIVEFKKMNIEFDFYTLFGYLSVFIAALCVVYWDVIGRLTVKTQNHAASSGGGIRLIISMLSNSTFGIYLMHILVMRFWLWKMAWVQSIHNYILQTMTIAILTMTISTVLSALFSRLPLLHHLTGYRYKVRNT